MKKLTSFLFCLGLGILMTQSLAVANLIDDPSFDAIESGTTNSNSAWVLSADAPDTTNLSALFWEAGWASNDAADPMHGVWFRAFEGGQDPGDPGANADVAQDVVVSQAGDYILRFDTRREGNFLTEGNAGEAWGATLSSSGGGSTSLDLLASAADGAWYTQSMLLSGVNAGDTVSVNVAMAGAIINSTSGAQNSAFVDNFSLTLVPEPTSLLLAGMGSLGFLLRRRR